MMEKTDDNIDCLMTCMHPEGSLPSFHWPQKDDICWVEIERILRVIQQGQDDRSSPMKTYRRA
jgi:hypothetical protein